MKRTLHVLFFIFLVSLVVPSSFAQVRINEVGTNDVAFQGAEKWVELYNAGADSVDVGLLILCDFPQYPEIRALPALAGGTKIAGGEYLVVSWTNLDNNNTNDAEVGLYNAGTFDFDDETRLIDYMQWGVGDHRRARVAETAGIWTASEFVAAPSAGQSMQYVDNGVPGAGNWVLGDPTPGEENGVATAVENEQSIPSDFSLVGNFPNPFNPTTTIVYELGRSGEAALSVYNILGQKVIDLFSGSQLAGRYEYIWDGRDDRGTAVASGVYFYRLSLDGEPGASRVMTLLK
ncbi:MAG: T9SS type A sorting domain-containing protein [Rhodothermaceae bacterium]|nr:T9SS type A sorting domain-containing protein [Rhodothermaceae bacterium]